MCSRQRFCSRYRKSSMAIFRFLKKRITHNPASSFPEPTLFDLPSVPKTLASAKPRSVQTLDSNHIQKFSTSIASCSLGSSRSSARSAMFCSPVRRFPQPASIQGFIDYGVCRWFSVSSAEVSPSDKCGADGSRPDITSKKASDIIDSIVNGDGDLEFNINPGHERLSPSSAIEVLLVLNTLRIPALPFFNWIRRCQPELSRKPDICSLIICNCGKTGDFESLLCLLKDFSRNNVTLTKKAFGFLSIVVSEEARDSVKQILKLLSEAGGSCLDSGIPSMVQMFSTFGSLELAKYVLSNSKVKTSYYNALIKEMCGRQDFNGARGLLEMRLAGSDPNAQTYNLVLSHLCKYKKTDEALKLVEKIVEKGCPHNALTFEILIHHLIRVEKWDIASKFLNNMEVMGIKPTLGTHAAFIKGHFNKRHYENAYGYVASASDKYKCSRNTTYGLLASLHRKRGNLVVAHNIFSEMMDKGLRPSYNVYGKLLKNLQRLGRVDLAQSLETRFSSLGSTPSIGDG